MYGSIVETQIFSTVNHPNTLNLMIQEVCNAFGERENLHTVWWLDALNHAEQNKDSTGELIRKIEEAVPGTLNNSRSSRIASRLGPDINSNYGSLPILISLQFMKHYWSEVPHPDSFRSIGSF
ncbi:hypothetical protein D5086_033385 [Populus alba]|uniref:Uncharacterized protein n=1 Tax=Populus alba TaxID=43335 RepID=A0ACC4AHE7_POPAL